MTSQSRLPPTALGRAGVLYSGQALPRQTLTMKGGKFLGSPHHTSFESIFKVTFCCIRHLQVPAA